jgi:hypothetical protein
VSDDRPAAPGRQLEPFDLRQKPARPVERVVPEFVFGRVRDPARQAHLDLDAAPVAEHQLELARLAQDHHVGAQRLTHIPRAKAAHLFLHHPGDDDGSVEFGRRRLRGDDHAGERRFHIAGAAPPEAPLGECARERRGGATAPRRPAAPCRCGRLTSPCGPYGAAVQNTHGVARLIEYASSKPASERRRGAPPPRRTPGPRG